MAAGVSNVINLTGKLFYSDAKIQVFLFFLCKNRFNNCCCTVENCF